MQPACPHRPHWAKLLADHTCGSEPDHNDDNDNDHGDDDKQTHSFCNDSVTVTGEDEFEYQDQDYQKGYIRAMNAKGDSIFVFVFVRS